MYLCLNVNVSMATNNRSSTPSGTPITASAHYDINLQFKYTFNCGLTEMLAWSRTRLVSLLYSVWVKSGDR